MGFKDKDFEKMEDMVCMLLEKSSRVRKIVKNIAKEDLENNSSYMPVNNTNLELERVKRDLKQALAERTAYKNECEQAKERISYYKGKYNDSENEKIRLEKDIAEYDRKLRAIENTLREEKEQKTELENYVSELKTKISEPIEYFESYSQLSSEIKYSLSNVISDKNIVTFIASCSNEDNLKSIWTYTKNIINNGYDNDDIETLKNIFDYFFEVFNDSLSEPKYTRDNVEKGDDFDDEYYDRSRESLTSGGVKEVILRGYKSRNTGKIICKSLVRV